MALHPLRRHVFARPCTDVLELARGGMVHCPIGRQRCLLDV